MIRKFVIYAQIGIRPGLDTNADYKNLPTFTLTTYSLLFVVGHSLIRSKQQVIEKKKHLFKVHPIVMKELATSRRSSLSNAILLDGANHQVVQTFLGHH